MDLYSLNEICKIKGRFFNTEDVFILLNAKELQTGHTNQAHIALNYDIMQDFYLDKDKFEKNFVKLSNKPRYCANCGWIIEPGESHFSFLDNFLQIKYFDSTECNIFCCKDCALKALSFSEIEGKAINEFMEED